MRLKSNKSRNDTRSPLSGYYGGKHRLAPFIAKTAPPHDFYLEPFFGGGSVLFLNNQFKKAVVSDTDIRMFFFWQSVKHEPYDLAKLLRACLNSELKLRELHEKSKEILTKGFASTRIETAFNVFINLNLSFQHIMNNGFYWDGNTRTLKSCFKSLLNKVEDIPIASLKLKNVEVLDEPALSLIPKFDKPGAFYYLDPPYPKANQGHYGGFKMEDFNQLTEALERLKHAKFCLSCYTVDGMTFPKGWTIKEKLVNFVTMPKKGEAKNVIKKEALIYNYGI